MNYLIGLLCVGLTFTSYGQITGDDILGIWWNPEMTTRVEVYQKNGLYDGKIIWLKENKSRLDINNKDESLRNRPAMGLVVMKELRWDGKHNEWDKGKLYDSHTGTEYSFYAKLRDDGSLSMFTYILGLPFLNKEIRCLPYSPND